MRAEDVEECGRQRSLYTNSQTFSLTSIVDSVTKRIYPPDRSKFRFPVISYVERTLFQSRCLLPTPLWRQDSSNPMIYVNAQLDVSFSVLP